MVAYAGFIISEFGLWMAMLVYAYEQGGAATAGLVGAAQQLPSAVVALSVAALVERSSPVVVLLGGYAVHALGAGATAVLILTDSSSWFVYLGAIVTQMAMSTTRPSQSALIPAITTEAEQLLATNVALGWVYNLGLLLSGIGVGVALEFGNPGHAYAGAALLAGGALLLQSPLRRLKLGARVVEGEGAGGESVADLVRVWRDRPTRLLVGLLGAEHLVVGALHLLFVVMAVDVLRAGEEWAGYLNTSYGAGSLVLAAVAGVLVGKRLGPVIALTAFVLGAALSAAVLPNLPTVVVVIAIVGGCRALFDIAVRVLLQRAVPPDRIAAAFGAAEGLSMLGLAVGSLLVPVLEVAGGPPTAIIGTAVVLPLLVLAAFRLLLRIDEHARVPVVEISLLRQISLFRVLPGEGIEALAHSLERVTFAQGDALMREGEPGDHYYAIAEGSVEVTQHDRFIRTLGRADGLGEIALLRSVPRTATAVASSPVTAYRLDRESFLTAVTGHSPTLESAHRVVHEHEERDARRDTAPPS